MGETKDGDDMLEVKTELILPTYEDFDGPKDKYNRLRLAIAVRNCVAAEGHLGLSEAASQMAYAIQDVLADLRVRDQF